MASEQQNSVFLDQVQEEPLENLTWMDECSSNQANLQRTHGRAPSGQRVPIRMSFWIRGTRISTLRE